MHVPLPLGYPWYAIRVRSRQEKIIASALAGKGYEVFLPLHAARRRWSDRIKRVELPLFPGYLFCRFDVLRRLPILTTPGIVEIVSVGRQIFPVDESEVDAVKAIVLSRLSAEPWAFLHVGQRVRIDVGPLAGIEGILLELRKGYRLVVSVTLLQRAVGVEVDPAWVTPLRDELPLTRSRLAAKV